jgi:peptidoglycan/xylan/chitin deacetylase (PgdA/CDA1 family)
MASCLASVRRQSLLLSGWLASRDAPGTDSRDFHSGHLLVNHTFRHRFADLWNLERFGLDLARCDEAICDALGETHHPLPWFRPPFGLVTDAVGEIAKTRRILPVTHFMIDPWVKSDRTRRPARWMIEDAKRRQAESTSFTTE